MKTPQEPVTEMHSTCPFCKSRNVIFHHTRKCISCDNCDAEGPWAKSEDHAWELWDRADSRPVQTPRDWHPMITAPKDGRTISLICENGKEDTGHWSRNEWTTEHGNGEPVGWQYPAAPTADAPTDGEMEAALKDYENNDFTREEAAGEDWIMCDNFCIKPETHDAIIAALTKKSRGGDHGKT